MMKMIMADEVMIHVGLDESGSFFEKNECFKCRAAAI